MIKHHIILVKVKEIEPWSVDHKPVGKPSHDKIMLLKTNLTEEEAFKHEKYMIAVFGRKDKGTGILRNRSDGGEKVERVELEIFVKGLNIVKKLKINRFLP